MLYTNTISIFSYNKYTMLADLNHAVVPLRLQQALLMTQQVLEPVHNEAALLLDTSIEGHRLCIVAQPSLQVPV